MIMWHDRFNVDPEHAYFVVAGNPDGNGGGVILSTNNWREAWDIMKEAERQRYHRVDILNYLELFR